jgi:hypothetical protein
MWKGNTNPLIAVGLFLLMLIIHILPIWLILYLVGQYQSTIQSIFRKYDDMPAAIDVEPTFRSLRMKEKLEKESAND